MKKILLVALVFVLAVSAVAFAACAQSQTVTGECSYTSWGTTYGVKVDVTVKSGIITAVKLYTDEESGFVRTTEGWQGFDAAEAAYANWIADTFVGTKVEEINALSVTVTDQSQTVGEGVAHISGATVSSARIIAAVQNALSKLAD